MCKIKRYRVATTLILALLLVPLLVPASVRGAQISTTPDTIGIKTTVLIFTLGQAAYQLNGTSQIMDVSPVARESRILLPIRYIAEPLGARADWNGAEGKVTITTATKTIELWLNNNTARINGIPVQIDPNNPKVMPAVVPPGRTMMPLRFIADNLDCQVEWYGPTNSVTVSYPK